LPTFCLWAKSQTRDRNETDKQKDEIKRNSKKEANAAKYQNSKQMRNQTFGKLLGIFFSIDLHFNNLKNRDLLS
jgi:hypothetical protein